MNLGYFLNKNIAVNVEKILSVTSPPLVYFFWSTFPECCSVGASQKINSALTQSIDKRLINISDKNTGCISFKRDRFLTQQIPVNYQVHLLIFIRNDVITVVFYVEKDRNFILRLFARANGKNCLGLHRKLSEFHRGKLSASNSLHRGTEGRLSFKLDGFVKI